MVKQPTIDIKDILAQIPPDEADNGAQALIEHAYAVAKAAHAGKERKSGEPYIKHPLSVAFLLTEIGMDTDTIAAGLLHDVVEDTNTSVETLRKEFECAGADIIVNHPDELLELVVTH